MVRDHVETTNVDSEIPYVNGGGWSEESYFYIQVFGTDPTGPVPLEFSWCVHQR